MEKTYTAIIIDDEIRARQLLAGMVSDLAPDIRIIAESGDLPNGVKAIHRHKPDLVFLDIEMPGHSGLELLDFFNDEEVSFDIIFTTAYSNYAVQAFKLSAIDYVLKPIEAEDLTQAIARFRKKSVSKNKALELNVLRENLSNDAQKRIAVPSGSSIRFIEPQQILYLKAEGSYTEINLADGSKLVVSRTLKNFEDLISNGSRFCRCHKSFVVNVNYVREYVKADGGYLVLEGNRHVSISPDKVDEMLKLANFISR